MSDLPPEELVKALRAVADAWSAHAEAVERLKVAIPAIEATPAERALYAERYKAADMAARLMRAEAQDFAKMCAETDAAALIERLEAREAELEGAATAFFAKWDECKPHIDDAFLHRQLRCGPYTGPDLAEELYALRKASKSLAQGEG